MGFKASTYRKCKPNATGSDALEHQSEAALRKVDHNSEGQRQPHGVSPYPDILVTGSSFVTELSADTCCFSQVHVA